VTPIDHRLLVIDYRLSVIGYPGQSLPATHRLVHQMNQDAPICIAWFTSSTRRDRARHRSRLADAAVLHGNDRRAGHRFLRRN
jgi:hypothetical protein